MEIPDISTETRHTIGLRHLSRCVEAIGAQQELKPVIDLSERPALREIIDGMVGVAAANIVAGVSPLVVVETAILSALALVNEELASRRLKTAINGQPTEP
jgi:hypothetical protein